MYLDHTQVFCISSFPRQSDARCCNARDLGNALAPQRGGNTHGAGLAIATLQLAKNNVVHLPENCCKAIIRLTPTEYTTVSR
jgi:hypothetical protein